MFFGFRLDQKVSDHSKMELDLIIYLVYFKLTAVTCHLLLLDELFEKISFMKHLFFMLLSTAALQLILRACHPFIHLYT